VRIRGGRLGVLAGVDIDVPEGGCVGVVGLNGAGKSTLLAAMAGVLTLDAGEVERPPLSYLPEGCPLDERISVRHWLTMATLLPGWEPAVADAMLAAFDLPPKAKRLSQGQRVRLGLVLTLGRRVPAYVLDDPFLGLDPVAKGEAERWIALRAESARVLLAAQDLDAIERLCTHLVVLHRGRVLAAASLDEWRSRYRAVHVLGAAPEVPALWRTRRGDGWELILDDPDHAIERRLAHSGARVDPLPLRLDELLRRMVS
jgi:ABC-2 type transport system ATP-binding protein